MDQIDSILCNRNMIDGDNTINQNILSTFLNELDGLGSSSNNIVVIGCCCSRENLDPAILRPGRFDIQIELSFPNYKDRIEFLHFYINSRTSFSSQNIIHIAKITSGFSYNKLEYLINEYTFRTTKNNETIVIEEIEDIINYIKKSESDLGL